MSTDKRGEAAFPLYGVTRIEQHGMTLRDYFAAQALPALITGRSWPKPDDADPPLPDQWARGAYTVADAMLEARTHTAAQAATDQKG